MKNYLSLSLASILTVLVPAISNGQLYVNATIGGVPSVAGATLETFNEPSPPILTLSAGASLVTGFISGQHAPPFFSGSTASYFGESPANGPDTTQYVGIGSYATATLSFSTPQNYLGLLWGSLDAANFLTFYDAANNLIGTVYGSTAVPVPVSYYGDQGVDGTYYVNITSTTPFSKVVASDSGPMFEFDDVAYALAVPEPTSLAFIAAGLCAAGIALRRRLA
jgi:hypothetical protein